MNYAINKTVKGSDLLSLALSAFLGLGFDALLAFLIEPLLYGVSVKEFNTAQSILHWTIICIIWGFTIWYLIHYAKKSYNITVQYKTLKIKLWQWVCIVLCIFIYLSWSIQTWEGFKVFLEYQKMGVLKFIFQYIYYAFETGLFVLIIVFGQQAFEFWFHHKNTVPIPYGGFVLAVTWGLVHILTKGSVETGLVLAASSILFGIVFLLLNRNYLLSCIVLYFIFII